jgi:uncharacterized membrane protein YGL010W
MQTRLQPLLDDYSVAHLTRGNRVCHGIGIPLIVVSLLGLLPLPVALGFWAVTAAWYGWMDWRLGVPFALMVAGALVLGQAMVAPALWAMFVGGWIFQGIGHGVYEKRSPSFFSNLRHILVGPIWIFSRYVVPRG